MDKKTSFIILMKELENALVSNNVDYRHALVLTEEMARILKEDEIELKMTERVKLVRNMSRLTVKARREIGIGCKETSDRFGALSGEMVSHI